MRIRKDREKFIRLLLLAIALSAISNPGFDFHFYFQ